MALDYSSMIRHDTYIENEHYWIRWHNGQHEVLRENENNSNGYDIVFEGHIEDCENYLQELEDKQREIDLDI